VNGLVRAMREYAENRDGKIDSGYHLWRFLDSVPKRAARLMRHCVGGGLKEFDSHVDKATGREVALFKGRGVKCKKPDRWTGIFPLMTDRQRPYFIVPAADCKACEFHGGSQSLRQEALCQVPVVPRE
jgi:hypothetical protein